MKRRFLISGLKDSESMVFGFRRLYQKVESRMICTVALTGHLILWLATLECDPTRQPEICSGGCTSDLSLPYSVSYLRPYILPYLLSCRSQVHGTVPRGAPKIHTTLKPFWEDVHLSHDQKTLIYLEQGLRATITARPCFANPLALSAARPRLALRFATEVQLEFGSLTSGCQRLSPRL